MQLVNYFCFIWWPLKEPFCLLSVDLLNAMHPVYSSSELEFIHAVMRINSIRKRINFWLGPQLRSVFFVGALSSMMLFVNSTNSPTNFMPVI